MLTKSNTMKIERKSKNKSIIKTSIITTRNPIKKNTEIISRKEKKEVYTLLSKNRYSISSKEDIKIENTKNNLKQFNKKLNYNNQILGTSNCILPTNYTDKEEEKNLRHLGNLFRKSDLKKTIIIDNEGNNNLNLNKNLFLDSKDHQINFQKIKNNINNFKNENLFQQNKTKKIKHNKVISDNIIPSSIKLNNIKLSKENNERVKEYGFIFNILNTNLEEMKDMFIKSPLIIKDEIKEKKENKKHKNKRNYAQIFSEKDKEEINKIKPLNESDNKNYKENSFLESCFQDDFYKNFVDENQTPIVNISNCSFDFSSMISDKSSSTIIINSNSDKTQCEIDENIDNNNCIHNFEINPHTLISKKNENKPLKKNKPGSKSTSNINVSNEKCLVF
jgi:hypothetical protein